MKQTAVDWLYERFLFAGYAAPAEWKEKAKEMEKEQRIEFANSFYNECGMQYGGLDKSAEQYYKETYENK
jgi:hypothetical protein